MNDEWRLQIDLHDSRHGDELIERMQATELEHDLSTAFADKVIVSRNDDRIFLYAGLKEQIESARELLLALAAKHGWAFDLDLRRWHPIAEDWEDPDKPLPGAGSAETAEREAFMRAEDREAEERGYPQFEVRVDLGSRHEAARFAEQLQGEGLPTVHRWRYLLVGASDEDLAKALAERIRSEAPADSKVAVEGTWKAAYAERGPSPFAFLGGLAG
jgi:hypothetical protein